METFSSDEGENGVSEGDEKSVLLIGLLTLVDRSVLLNFMS